MEKKFGVSTLIEKIETINLNSIKTNCAVIYEDWPSWAPVLTARNFDILRLFGSNTKSNQNLFRNISLGAWRSKAKINRREIEKYQLTFISGRIEFLESLSLSSWNTNAVILVEGPQPHRRRLEKLGFTWERIKHYCCGGVTQSQFWFGYNSHLILPKPTGLYPERYIGDVMSAAIKEF